MGESKIVGHRTLLFYRYPSPPYYVEGGEFREYVKVDEASLLEVIKKRLPPEQRERLNYLRQRNEDEEITDAEHEELLMYIERVEEQDVERMEALIKLAQLRSCDLKIVIDEFLPKHSNIV